MSYKAYYSPYRKLKMKAENGTVANCQDQQQKMLRDKSTLLPPALLQRIFFLTMYATNHSYRLSKKVDFNCEVCKLPVQGICCLSSLFPFLHATFLVIYVALSTDIQFNTLQPCEALSKCSTGLLNEMGNYHYQNVMVVWNMDIGKENENFE